MCFIEKVTAIGRVTAIGYRPAVGCDIYFYHVGEVRLTSCDNVTCQCLRSDVDIFVRFYDRMKDREDNAGDEVYF